MTTELCLTDTHAHLNDPKFSGDLDEVMSRAEQAGVGRMIVCGYDIKTSRGAVGLASRHETIYAAVGIHPHDAKTLDDDALAVLAELSANPKVLAIGEIGLDFHYDFSPRPDQFAAFEAQIDLAAALDLPIIIHSRESNPEVLQVLAKRMSNIKAGVFHCFSGDEAFAREALDAGFYIGVDGPITYQASEKLRGVVAMCPDDRLLIETDCPYLTPIPHRGKRNEPAYLRYVAEEVARVRGTDIETIARRTSRNARKLFGERLGP